MNILVVGAGAMGQNHVRVFSELERVRRVVVAEPSEEMRKKLAERNFQKTVAYPSLAEALAKEKVDAASVVVPTRLHYSVASSLIARKIPILIEKPICDNLDDARKLAAEAKAAKVPLMVGHVERFNPAVRALKKHLHSLGDVFYASARRLGVPTQRDVGEAFYDQAVHDIDVISFVAGKYPTHVSALEARVLDGKSNDLCAALFEYDGFRAAVEANRVTPIKTRELLVLGTKGEARLNYISQDLVITLAEQAVTKYSTFDELVLRVGRGSELKPYFTKEEPLKAELSHFLDVAKGTAEPLVTAEDGIHALAAVMAGIASAKSGKREAIKAV
jgi:UDP-N-acetylglucosamine 3-dehydrogenase